mgnify:CR=1 FL=1
MDILYATEALQRLCLTERIAKKKLGASCAKKLRARIEDLASARWVSELIAGRPHPLTGVQAGKFSVRLQGGCRLVFEPANEPIPTKENDGSIAWGQVDRVRIVYIGDYHD